MFFNPLVDPNIQNILNFGEELSPPQKKIVDMINTYRHSVVVASRRLGKTHTTTMCAMSKLVEPDKENKILVVAPTLDIAKIIWREVYKIVKKNNLETVICNSKDRTIELVTGSTFRIASLETKTSLVGRGYDFIIIDEASRIPTDEFFIQDLAPTMTENEDARAIFISTPLGREQFLFEYYNRGEDPEFPDWGSILIPYTENPRVPLARIEADKKKMGMAVWRQEYLCDFLAKEDQVFEIDDDAILEKNLHKQSFDEYFGCLDVGYKDPNAFCIVGYNEANELYAIIDEFRTNQITTSDLANLIKEKVSYHEDKGKEVDDIYIDAAAAQTRADLADDHDIDTIKGYKPIKESIVAMQDLISAGKIKIDPDTATLTYKSLKELSWNPKKKVNPEPYHDIHSHLYDAARYGIVTHARSNKGTSLRIFTL